MKKLTQQEASELIQKAWQEVSNHTLGSYRFGQSLFGLVPEEVFDQYKSFDEEGNYGYGENFYKIDFFYEPDSNIATEKFYKYFVEREHDHL